MFESLQSRLGGVFDKLRGRGALSEADVDAALAEVRTALIDADVALPVVKEFIDKVRPRAIGENVIRSVTPGQQVIKIVHDVLVETLGSENAALNLGSPPAPILMVGLQGSGKTTTSAKLGLLLQGKEKKKVLMASLDVNRPAAMEQLRVLGEQAGVATLPVVAGQDPLTIARRAMASAKVGGYDVLILDTAGRQSIDEQLMSEVAAIKAATNPHETLLVADSLTGQDAVNIAKNFNDRVELSGIILTRVDGDARGGAALSMRAVTGAPIKFLGAGEKLDALEAFHPARVAARILDMGDVVSLVERAAETLDKDEAEKIAAKMKKGTFDMNDLRLAIEPDEEAGRDERRAGHAARRRQDQEPARCGRHRRQDPHPPGSHHLLHDQKGTARSRPDQRLAQEAHRRRRRGGCQRGQQASENAPPDGGHDEEDGQGRPHAADARMGGGMPGGFPPGMFPGRRLIQQSRKGKTMALRIRLARGGTKKRPHYSMVISDSPQPRDGRFIEKIGFYNPLLPSDHADRLKLDLDEAKAWIAKGAVASDRVHKIPGQGRRGEGAHPQQSAKVPAQEEGAGTRAAAAAKGGSTRRRRSWRAMRTFSSPP